MMQGLRGQWQQKRSLIKNALKKWFEKINESNIKTLLLNLKSLKGGRATLSALLDPKSVHPAGMTKMDWWHESWKNQSCKATSGLFWRGRWGISMAERDRGWNSGPSLRSWEQKTVYGIPPQSITSTKEIQHPAAKLMWLYSRTLKMLCSLTSWKKALQWTQNTILKPLKYLRTHITEEEENYVLLQQDNARPHTSAAIALL